MPRLKAKKSKDNNIEPCVVCTDSNVVQLFCLLAEQNLSKLSQLGLKLPRSRCQNFQKCLECLNLTKTIKGKLKLPTANGMAINLECTSTFEGFFFFIYHVDKILRNI